MHNELCKTDIPKMFEISDVVVEAKGVKSFYIKEKLISKPGQFIMVWIPKVDEKPMAISFNNKKEFAFASHAIGPFTKALDKMKKGDKVGIRGPYGNSFSIEDNACVIGGGIGMSSVATLIDKLKNPIIINGARDKEHLIYLKRYKNENMIVTTDDGSYGRKGFTISVLEEILKGKKISPICERGEPSSLAYHGKFFSKPKIVYTCGPEIMMKKVFDICQQHKIEIEASLERYMKCGFGVCGNCMVNDQIICVDGTIFNSKQLEKMSEFGNFARLKTGRKVALKEYYRG